MTKNRENIFLFITCWRNEAPNDENRRKNLRKVFRLSLYGDLSGILGGVFRKIFKNFFSHPLLENKIPFGPLFEKKLIIFNHPRIDKPREMHFDGVILKISAKVFSPFIGKLRETANVAKNLKILYPSAGRSRKRQKLTPIVQKSFLFIDKPRE